MAYENPVPEIYVDTNEWCTIQDEGILKFQTLGTSIGVSIYYPDSKTAFVGDFLAQSLVTTDALDELISAASDARHGRPPRVWVGGGDVGSEECDDETTYNDRQTVLDKLTGAIAVSGRELKIEWLEQEGSIDYSINVATGMQTTKIELEADRFDDESYDWGDTVEDL